VRISPTTVPLQVLVVDRSGSYGGDCGSLNLTDLFRRFNKGADPPAAMFEALGRDRDYNVDLIPKFIMAEGVLKDVLVKTRVHRSIQATAGFAGIGGCYVFSKSAGKGWFSSGGAGVEKVPSTPSEAMSSSLLGVMQKTQLRSFLVYVDACTDPRVGPDSVNLTKITARDLYAKYFSKGDEDLPQFVGHGIALFANDDYLSRPASELVAAIKMYRDSISRAGTSPFIYPVYGLSTLPEAFSRLCAVQGGVFILRTEVQEVVYEDGKAVGVVAKPDFADSPQAARAPIIVADPTYLPEAKRPPSAGNVVRSIMITDAAPRGVKTTSAQIIVPQAQVGRRHDIYVSMLSSQHMVCAKGKYIVIASTTQETKGPIDAELKPVLDLFEPHAVIAKFDSDAVVYKPHDKVPTDGVFCTGSYDATTHFESVMDDVAQVWKLLTGESLQDFSVTDEEESGSGASASASAAE
jgi:Rab GDP dissociation inhibitor